MNPSLARALRLRCPTCGAGRLFRGWFRMHDACGSCGATFKREQGFYLGSIYINYGITVIVTGAAYALLVLGLDWTHETALAICIGIAVLFPVWFFRYARSLLLALDGSVNRRQAAGGDASAAEGMAALSGDDARAGCAMGVALALVLLFGLGMAIVTILFAVDAEAAGHERGSANRLQTMPRDSSSAITASTHLPIGHSWVGSTRSGLAGAS